MPNGKKTRREVAVIDAETDPFLAGREPKPFLWGFYDGSEYLQFDHTPDLVEYLSERELIVYAHNGGKFDFFFLADHFELYEPIKVINGRLSQFKIGLCEFRDSWNILPVPLAAHDKGEIEYWKFAAEHRGKYMHEISAYLKRDCLSLYGFVSRYIEEFGLNMTLAAGAMKTWQRMTEIDAPQTTAEHYHRFKPFYYGGRVECFRKGIVDREFSVADINSAYPFAMLHEHAYGSTFIQSEALPVDQARLARSFIHLRADSLGAFPWRADTGLVFPADGEPRDFHITGWEFIAARETKTLSLHEVYSVSTPLETVSFVSYVERFFAMKAAAKESDDTAGYLLAKLHLNSLYGKFGANPEEYQEFLLVDQRDLDAVYELKGYTFCDFFGPHCIVARPLPEEKRRYYNVATAASVTGFVRAHLWSAINRCDGVLYCDTDSIVAADTSALPLGAAVGQWNIEAECDFAAIAGKKLYAFRRLDGSYKTASKGVRLSAAEIVRVAKGETVTYEKDAPTYSAKNGLKWIARDVSMT